MIHSIKDRWYRENGWRDVLRLAIPLILSTGAVSIQHFVDRMFLTWYEPAAVAASLPAGIVHWTIMSLFVGTAGYVNTFVSQYWGAESHHRIGPSIWQGMYVAIIGGMVSLLLIPLARPLFTAIGHDPAVMAHEITYFRILCTGGFTIVGAQALAGFYTGQSRTWTVMWVNVTATMVNIVLDYLLIFGNFGFPRLGIAGAAAATVIATVTAMMLYLILILNPAYEKQFRTRSGWRLDRELFARVMRYGLPNGIQFCLDMTGFTVFLLLIGRLGTSELAATNIAFNINTLAFMPMIGMGMAVNIIVGQNQGKGNSMMAERSVYTGFQLTFLYMTAIGALYLFTPGLFLAPYEYGSAAGNFAHIKATTIVLLRFVALYSLFDGMTIVFASALKGAGDTRFVMLMLVGLSFCILVIPSYLALTVFKASLYTGWTIATTYICVLGISYYVRFRRGAWKSMRVIEHIPPHIPPTLPTVPTTEVEL